MDVPAVVLLIQHNPSLIVYSYFKFKNTIVKQ